MVWCVLRSKLHKVVIKQCLSLIFFFFFFYWMLVVSVNLGYKGSMFTALTQKSSSCCLVNTTFDESCLLPKQTSRTSDHFKYAEGQNFPVRERKKMTTTTKPTMRQEIRLDYYDLAVSLDFQS